MKDDSKKFGDKFNKWMQEECPKAPCEICGQMFPDVILMHVSRTDRRISCGACAMKGANPLLKRIKKSE